MIKTYYDEVLTILANIPQARDDDRYLTVCLWKQFTPHHVSNFDNRDYVSMKAIVENLPHSDSIERARRVIQNDLGIYPPTTLRIAKKRRMREEDWREERRHKITHQEAQEMLNIYLKKTK